MSAVTASLLVGSKNRTDLGIQPRWIVLLHEANGYAWHLLRLQLSSGDIVEPPRVGVMDRSAPGTRAGLDGPPGILWRAAPGGDLVGELALLLHLHAARTPEVLAAVRGIQPLAKRRVDLANLDPRERGDLANAVRIARETGGGLYLAATIMAGSRLTEEGLLELPDWEINLAATVLARDWVRLDGGRLETTDYRETPQEQDEGPAEVFGSVAFHGPGGEAYAEYTYGSGPTAPEAITVDVRRAPTAPAATPASQAPPAAAASGPAAAAAEDPDAPAVAEDPQRSVSVARARVIRRERELREREVREREVLPDQDEGLDSARPPGRGDSWLDDFLHD